ESATSFTPASCKGPDRSSMIPGHLATEDYLAESGLTHTILRTGHLPAPEACLATAPAPGGYLGLHSTRAPALPAYRDGEYGRHARAHRLLHSSSLDRSQ